MAAGALKPQREHAPHWKAPGRADEMLNGIFARIASPGGAQKFDALKRLRRISASDPGIVYAHFGRLVALLDHANKIVQWGAIVTIGNLAAVDSHNKIEAILERFLQPICGPVMITAANTIRAAGQIAAVNSGLAERIGRAFLLVERAKYQTPECRNVALGHVISALPLFFEKLPDQQPLLALVTRQLNNRRPAVRKKAAAFLERYAARLQKGVASTRAHAHR